MRGLATLPFLLLSTFAGAQQPQPLPVLQWGFWGVGPAGAPDDYLHSNVPIHAAMPNAVAVAGGFFSAAALTPDGRVYTWGSNDRGQLGDGTNTNRANPAPVPGLDRIVAIAAGSYHVLALRDDHSVWSWGFNQSGQLGDLTTTNRNSPVQVTGLGGAQVVAVAAGNQHSLALTSDGRVFAWGSHQYGQLGLGEPLVRYVTATLVTSLASVAVIDALGDTSIAALGDGRVFTWGSNRTGALGDGTKVDRSSPVWTGLSNAVGVAAGGDASGALLGDGTVATWGQNNHLMLGDGTSTDRLTPGVVPNLTDVRQLDAGFGHMVVLRQDGTVWVWGGNADWGQLGLGMPITFGTAVPLQVPTVTGVRAIVAGGVNVLGLGYLVGETITATIAADGPLDFCEGGSVTLTAGGGSSYLWSNGSSSRSITVTNSGSYSVTVSEGGLSAESDPVVVSVAPRPAATVTPSGPTSLCAGGSVLLTASGGVSYLWSTGATGPSILVNSSGSYGVTATSAEGCAATSSPIQVSVEPLPSIAASAGAATEGGAFALTGSASGATAFGPVLVDWGDTSPAQAVSLDAGGAFGATHVYVDDGSYTVRLRATSPAGCATESTRTALVGNAAPVITSLVATLAPTLVGTAVIATAAFDDAGLLDSHMAEWTWGDGQTAAVPVTRGEIQAAHAYSAPGVYGITLRVTDDDGATAVRTFEFVVIYDPNGGFVTGGGWIDSPAGSYIPNPSLTGKASFGFVSKYQNGAGVPTGNTEFQFRAASFNFKSTSYAWLVVAGARAQFRGTGTVNGTGDYEFLLTAIDGQVNGAGGTDKFRIKIWSTGSGVIYDNMRGADDGSDPVTILGGGSIVIHKP